MIEKSERLCKFYASGKCRFGNQCKFSHQAVECLMIRHAESVYNQVLDENFKQSLELTCAEQPQDFNFDPSLIDCEITEKGQTQVQSIEFPPNFWNGQRRSVDAIFVSPLERALQTTSEILKIYKVECKEVIVLPNLTEVLSKMCDFSSSIQGKMLKYPKFNFKYFDFPDLECWQDTLVDADTSHLISQEEKNGHRYLSLLKSKFPSPLENSYSCYGRSMQVIKEIKNICLEKNYGKIIVVSHNRILKYISGREESGKVAGLQNCEARSTYI